MRKYSFYLSLLLFSSVLFFNIFNKNNKTSPPIPTEFVEKKENKNKFKQNRQKWIENMHRAAPGIDWRKIDYKNRRMNTDKVREYRKTLFLNNQTEDILDNFVDFHELLFKYVMNKSEERNY